MATANELLKMVFGIMYMNLEHICQNIKTYMGTFSKNAPAKQYTTLATYENQLPKGSKLYP